MHFCCLSSPASGILSWKPKQTIPLSLEDVFYSPPEPLLPAATPQSLHWMRKKRGGAHSCASVRQRAALLPGEREWTVPAHTSASLWGSSLLWRGQGVGGIQEEKWRSMTTAGEPWTSNPEAGSQGCFRDQSRLHYISEERCLLSCSGRG